MTSAQISFSVVAVLQRHRAIRHFGWLSTQRASSGCALIMQVSGVTSVNSRLFFSQSAGAAVRQAMKASSIMAGLWLKLGPPSANVAANRVFQSIRIFGDAAFDAASLHLRQG